MFRKIKNAFFRYKLDDRVVTVYILFFKFKIRMPKVLSTNRVAISSKTYGKIWLPYYNQDVAISGRKPDIYDKDGNKKDIFFLRDAHSAHCPYTPEMCSKYFLFDRFNFGLDVHFYTHGAMLETMGNPKKRYGMLIESPSIVPNDYKIFDLHRGLYKDFDKIFTYDEKILDTVKNACFFQPFATMWYSREMYDNKLDSATLSPDAWQTKNKMVSMVCSNKIMTEMHRVRHRIARDAQRSGKVDIFGRFNNGVFMKYKSESLKDYRFQIVVENDILPYYFTEKIMDCFAAQTIPIYIGATKIQDFFNPAGIITINKDTDIDDILKYCTVDEYNQRLAAVKENYSRALLYLEPYDWLYGKYLMNNIGENA